MSRTYGWKAVLVLLCALWTGPVAQARAEAPFTDGHRLVVTSYYGCAIEQEGRLGCFGQQKSHWDPTPEGRYLSVSIGSDAACAVRSDGEAVCWAMFAENRLSPPPGPWRSLSVAFREACGLRPDGQMVCWGTGGSLAPPSGPFLALSISVGQGCAIRNDGTLQCWTRSYTDVLGTPPPGRFSRVEVSTSHACGLRSDGRVLCWGDAVHGNTDAPAEAGFIDVSVGTRHNCALRADGTALCWGSRWGWDNGSLVSMPMESPQGTFTELGSRQSMGCGRRPDGRAECWAGATGEGDLQNPHAPALTHVAVGGGEVCVLDVDGEAHCSGSVPSMQPPPGRYSQLSLGGASGCGILRDDSTACWGVPLGPAPMVAMSKVSVGEAHACGISMDGAVVCWGDNSFGQIDAPLGDYLTVVAGGRYSCAITVGGTVECWGQDPLVSGVPVGNGFRTLLANNDVVCANRESGAAQCWGDGGAWLDGIKNIWYPVAALGDYFACWRMGSQYLYCGGDASRPMPAFPFGDFIAIAAAGDQACVLDKTSQLDCSGGKRFKRRFNTVRIGIGGIAAGTAHTCSTDSGGLIDCWGDNASGQRDAPQAFARALAASGDQTCAIVVDNTLQCWGDVSRSISLPLPGTAVRTVDVGRYNGCAVRSDGDAACWGWNVNGQGSPPTDAFQRVATGLNHSCGIRDDGTLACWGYGADGQTSAPTGEFIALDVGERHSCAIAVDGGLQCWGMNGEGQSAPPLDAGATYRALSTGSFHNCAIRSDGVLVCWGRNDNGQSTPPKGRFASVSAGVAHSCAVRDDGARLCWGGNESGQSPSLAIVTADLPRGDPHVPYEARLMAIATAGYAPRSLKYRVVSGALPAGIALERDGLLRGWPLWAGVSDFVVEVRDTNGLAATRPYRLQIGPSSDTTPPSIAAIITGTLGDNGWYTGDVHVRWDLSDAESGISETHGCIEFVRDVDAVTYGVTCRATNRAGQSHLESGQFKRDATPPKIRLYPQSEANAEGWFKAPVTVVYSCSDETSGLAGACPQAVTLSTEGVQLLPIRSVRDYAGNIATAPATQFRIDMTRPELTAIMPPAQLPVGATHDFQARAMDALSGVLSMACTPVDTSTPTVFGTRVAVCTAVDRAGNSTSVSSVYEVVPQARSTGGAGQPARQSAPASKPARRVLPQPVQRAPKPAKPRAG